MVLLITLTIITSCLINKFVYNFKQRLLRPPLALGLIVSLLLPLPLASLDELCGVQTGGGRGGGGWQRVHVHLPQLRGLRQLGEVVICNKRFINAKKLFVNH